MTHKTSSREAGGEHRSGTGQPLTAAFMLGPATGFARWEVVRQYLRLHPVLFPVLLLFTFGAPFATAWLPPLWSLAGGELAGGVGLFVGLRAATEVRERIVRG